MRFIRMAGAGAMAAVTMLSAGDAFGQAGAPILEKADVTTHRSQGEVRPVEGGEAGLLRTADGIFVSFETEGLTPGHVYTLLLATINNASACETRPCQPNDVLVRTADTSSEIRHVAGGVADESGRVHLAAFQPVGDVGNDWFRNGLTAPDMAEVHLILNDHGPLVPELAATMLTTYRGGCADEGLPGAFPATAKANGQPGPNTCRLVQVAIFQPPGM